MPKYRVLPKVNSFLHEGTRYLPGDIVELPKRIGDRKDWLERFTPPKTDRKEKSAKPVSKEETSQTEESFQEKKTKN